jgi:hypothetical protein
MKNLLKILIILVLFTIAVIAQEKTEPKKLDPSTEKEETKTEEVKKEENDKQKFVDENGDGIDDNQQGKGLRKRKGKTDKFVDNDGDGINDNRCQGMGWGKGKQKGYGKHSR